VNRASLALVVVLAILTVVVWRAASLIREDNPKGTVVGLIFDDASDRADRRTAWDAYAQEQGLPVAWISQEDATLIAPADLAARYSALVLPDGLDAYVSTDLAQTLAAYARDGGTVVVGSDAGSRLQNGRFAKSGALDALLGVRTIRFTELGAKAFGRSRVRFASALEAARWHVPFGKLDATRALSSYHYGGLRYAVSATSLGLPDVRVVASSALGPAITERTTGLGHAIYVGLPVAYLRGRSDGFPLHALVRRALLDIAGTPHLVAAPNARGALIINWHIDSNAEWRGIPNLLATGLLRHPVRYDFDVTAGPDVLVAGDGGGFDACGKGARYLRTIEPYGSIGSHGGWLHNGFAFGVERGTFSAATIRSLILRNDRCLERMTGRAIRDYAAPDGAHPQPSMTQTIEALGHVAYYYTGDTGAPAERALYGGSPTSARVWAFPIQPDGTYASISEIARGHAAPANMLQWLDGTLDTVERDRTISLVYSHAYDMLHRAYVPAYGRFLDRVERDQTAGTLATTTMAEAADFLARFSRATFSFSRGSAGIRVRLHDDAGLAAIAFALPRAWHPTARVPAGLRDAGGDAIFHYYAATGDDRDLDITIPTETP